MSALMRCVVLLATLFGVSALHYSSAAISSRRALLQKLATSAPLVIAAPAFAISPSEAVSLGKGGWQDSKSKRAFGLPGTYSDPAHNGCKRTVSFIGGRSVRA